MMRPGLKERLAGDDPLIGTWLTIPAPYAAEVIASAGFDWLCIDMQHGFIGDDLLPSMLMATNITGTPTLVRPRWNDPASIMRALDAGAAGVLVPLVNDADEARQASRACLYPPDGIRSWGPMRPVVGGSTQPQADVVCVIMVETPAAVENLREISDVPGIDGIFVGPSDLSLAVAGRLGEEIATHTTSVAARCRDDGLVPGIACGGTHEAAAAVTAGFRLLTVSWDVALLGNAATHLTGSVREQLVHVRERHPE